MGVAVNGLSEKNDGGSEALLGLPRPGEPAARVDGASGWRAYRSVTLPLLRPALLVAAVLNAIYVFNSFPIIWTLNDRNPGLDVPPSSPNGSCCHSG